MDLVEHSESTVISLYGLTSNRANIGKVITMARYEPLDILYFKYYRDVLSGECCRISMTSPEYIDGTDFILSQEELDLIIDIIENHNLWKTLIRSENEAREEDDIEILIDIDIPVPDYSMLEVS